MRDSLFGARDASDLLLPQRPLAQLLPLPALAWLRAHGATVHLRTRVDGTGARRRSAGACRRTPSADDLRKPDAAFDHVILATPATEAARLTQTLAPAWSATAAALAHEPIVTIVAARAAARLARAHARAGQRRHDARPAQFAFKLGEQQADVDRVTLVVSAAGRWLSAAATPSRAAADRAISRGLRHRATTRPIDLDSVRADKRATFRCTAGVVRPPMDILPGLRAAADYVAGPYPATLEAAVLAGEAAASALGR